MGRYIEKLLTLLSGGGILDNIQQTVAKRSLSKEEIHLAKIRGSYEFRKIAENTWLINEFNVGTVYLLVGSKRALLIDTSLGMGDLFGLVRHFTSLPLDVAATHGHVDHVGGRGQFPRMYVHKEDLALVPPISDLYRFGYAFLMPQLRRFGMSPADVRRYPFETELLAMEEGHVFSLGGREVEVLSAPGHTKGSVYLLDRKNRLLFSGDNVNPCLLLNVPGSCTVETHIKGVRWVLDHQTEFDGIYCGHGSRPLTIPTVENCFEMAWEILTTRKRNTRFPGVKTAGRDGNQIYVYRTDRVFD